MQIPTGHGLLVFVVALIALGVAPGCGDDDDQVAALRPGARLVHEGVRFESFNAATPNVAYIKVQDVGHVEGRWVVTVRMKFQDVPTFSAAPVGCPDCGDRFGSAAGTLSFPLATSTDGQVWEPLIAGGAPWQSGYLRGVHPYAPGDAAWAVGEVQFSGAGGDTYTAWRVQALDLVGEAFLPGPHDGVDLPGHPRPVGAMLSGVWPADERGDYLTAFVLRNGELETMQVTISDWRKTFLVGAVNGWLTESGFAFTNYFRTIYPHQRCWTQAILDSQFGFELPYTVCTNALEWPITAGAPIRMHRFSKAIMAIGEGNGRVWGVEVEVATPPVLHIHDLGSGQLVFDKLEALHPRYGTFVRIANGESTRFVDVRADGEVVAFTFPKTPCVPVESCTGDIEWLEPLGDGRYMVFWIAQPDQTAAIHELVLAEPMAGTRAPPDPDPEPWNSPVPGYPSAVPGGPLEAACLAFASCFPRSAFECLGAWSGASAEARERFIAARAQGCAALGEVWRGGVALGAACPRTGRQCMGDVLVECSPLQVQVAIDCALYGTRCEEFPGPNARCVDGSGDHTCNTCTSQGSAVICNGFEIGMRCGPEEECAVLDGSVGCFARAVCEPGPPRCEGDVAVGCGPARREERTDCALVGQRCIDDESGVRCDNPGSAERCQQWSAIQQCVGPYAVLCSPPDDMHYIDCRELGFSDCEYLGGTGLRCVP